MDWLPEVARDFSVGLVTTAVVALASWVWAGAVLTRARRLWPFGGDKFTFVVASSAVTQTGKYERYATGIGQAIGLAVIMPSVLRAWRKRAKAADVIFSKDVTSESDNNLILLGGPKNNSLTRTFLAKLRDAHPEAPNQVDSAIVWNQEKFEAVLPSSDDNWDDTPGDSYWHDYGLVVRWPNPMDRSKTVVLLSGASTYGTVAAALWYVGQRSDASEVDLDPVKSAKFLAVVVEGQVHKGHVGQPRFIGGVTL